MASAAVLAIGTRMVAEPDALKTSGRKFEQQITTL
jgi:hypothetical protein